MSCARAVVLSAPACALLIPQLAGVALAALQGGLGEATALGLCARYHSRSALTTWSSGTGFAGVAGQSWQPTIGFALLDFASTPTSVSQCLLDPCLPSDL